MHRVFLAIDLSEEAKELLLNEVGVKLYTNESYRFEPKDKLHFTLKFIGDVTSEKLEEIKQTLRNVKFSRFELMLNSFGFFYRDGNPSIFWSDVKINSALFALHSGIENGLNSIGIVREKRVFKPHITLLRIKNKLKSDFEERFNSSIENNIIFEVNNIVLYESILKQTSSEYICLERFSAE